MTATAPVIWPLAVYALMVVAMIATIVGTSYVLGQRHRERATGLPYESGIPVTGSARLRFSADFYLIAMFFVVFDLEAIFIFAWAVAARELGWPGYGAMAVFVGMLLAALAYLWRSGALEWTTTGRASPPPAIESEAHRGGIPH